MITIHPKEVNIMKRYANTTNRQENTSRVELIGQNVSCIKICLISTLKVGMRAYSVHQ